MAQAKPNTAAGLFSKLEADRTPYITSGYRCAELTIPSLFPKNPSNVDDLVTPYQSVGSRGVNNIAAKMMLALFPPNTPIFRLKIEDEVLESMGAQPAVKTKVEAGLAGMERRVTSELASRGLHQTAFEVFKHLIVVGNILLHVPDKGPLKTHWLHSYVVRRDSSGEPLDIVLQEKIARVALPIEIQEALAATKDKDAGKEDVTIYTHVSRTATEWVAYQEVAGAEVPGTRGTYPLERCPWIPLRLIKQDGKNYGRSYVEEYRGDLLSLEGLSQALLEGSIAAAKILFLVNPNGSTEKTDLARAKNGDYVDGNAADVTAMQLQKYNDFRVAKEQADTITERLSFAFLLNSAVQRRGERVTAEEIRYVASELEDSLGGLYSLLSKELQMPLVSRVLFVLQKAKALPKLPNKDVTPVIITGMEALGRGNDLGKLELAMSKVAVLGPAEIAKRINASDFIERVFTACGVTTVGLIRSDEEVQQADQQAMMQQMMQQGLNPAITAGGNIIKEGMSRNDQSQPTQEGA